MTKHKFARGVIATATLVLAGSVTISAQAADKVLLGLVSIAPAEDNNARFITGAKKAAEKLGWDVTVVDAQGSADKANAAMQNLVQRGAKAIVDMVFPVTSLSAGLAATQQANVPVASWGGGMGKGVAATNGSGGLLAQPIGEMLVKDLGGNGSILMLTYRTGQVCREREEVLDAILKSHPGIKVTKNEVPIPGYFQAGASFANAWLAGRPAGKEKLAIWGCWDDPALGAISAMRQQDRRDIKVYGQNGNAQAIAAIRSGWMTGTAWQDSVTEGVTLVNTLADAAKSGAAWQPKAVEVKPVIVTKDSVEKFIADVPGALGN